MTDLVDVTRVRALNDSLRHSLCGGRLVLTPGIATLGREHQQTILAAVAAFDRFDANNDPHGEHDFGALEAVGQSVFWKIDYYDPALTSASPDPADPSRTVRVLTVMLAEEY